MAVDKSTYNRKIKVSQSTIDDIKKLGMTKALRLAKENSKATQGGLVAEYQEATRRLYGDRRFAAATGTAIKKAPGTKVYNPKYASKPSPANPKQADKALYKKPSTSYSPAPMKTPAKKSGGVSNTAKVVAGTAAAIGILAVTRGRGTGAIAKVAPGFSRSGLGKVLMGTGKPFVPKGLGPKVTTKASTAVMKAKDAAAVARGKAAAKAGKPVSQSQYDAMVAAAKAKGVSTTAKKATTTAVKKTTAKKAAAAPTQSRWDANAPKPKAVKPPKTK